ncbi:MAG: hypothetical protein Ta2A_01540 [Treponemataceae bacterium]|nr:MAG: hypothetical protein Ta2A_01540 [Treponemataceae bacterium]
MQKIKFSFRFLFALCAIFVYFSASAQTQNTNNPIVRSLKSTPTSASEVQLTWDPPEYFNPGNPIVGYNIYRDKTMIKTTVSLSLEKLVASVQPTELSYTDTVDYESTYYYAVIVVTRNYAFNLVTLGSNSVINGTSTMQHMLSKNLDARSPLGTNITSRSLGLPFLGSGNSPETAVEIPDDIDRFSVNSALTLTHIGSYLNLRSPSILQVDTLAADTENDVDATHLNTILKNYFAVGKFPEAHRQFDELLRVAKSETIKARIHFYMGQCEYYLGNFSLSVQSFLAAKYLYPIEAYDWINTVLKIAGR